MRILLFIILIIPLCSNAQKIIVTTPSRANIYSALDNVVEVVVEGYKCDEILLTTNNGTVNIYKLFDSCQYLLKPIKSGRVLIEIYDKKNGKKLGEKNFYTQKFPNPMILIDGRYGGDISISRIKLQEGVQSTIQDFFIELKVVITSYTIIILRNNKAIYVQSTNSSLFTEETREVLQKLEINDRIIISNATYRSVNHVNGIAPPVEFRVVE